MQVTCIKSCEEMTKGDSGEFKGARTINSVPYVKVKLRNGRIVRVKASCCALKEAVVA